MECYEGATMIKTFRGQIADDTQDTIVLHTNDGSTGYRVVKFQVVTAAPGTANLEHVLKIYKVSQSTIDTTIDFSDNRLLAVAVTQDYTAAYQLGWNQHIIFDQEVFNQDIYITHKEGVGNALAANYYIELEQVKLDLGENTVATLKDIRNTKTQGF
jgi:hypothetical protein